MTAVSPDTRTCLRCGMPLAYDAAVSDADRLRQRSDENLCTFCDDPSKSTRLAVAQPARDVSWVLDLILDVYCGRRPGVRSVARAISRMRRIMPTMLVAIADIVQSVPRRSAESQYDAIVLYSGGKDSTYMLLDLVRRKKVRICAWMLQQGYQSPTAIANAKRICEQLGVPLVIAQPERPKMDTLFRLGFGVGNEDEDSPEDIVRSAMTYGSACWPCFATISAQGANFCRDTGAAFCFIATQQGQNRLDLHGQPVLAGRGLPRAEFMVEKFMSRFRDLVQKRQPGAAKLLETQGCDAVLVPFYELVPKPPVDEQVAAITKAGWRMPNNTGACSTNCMINELGRHVSRKRYGFDLYQIIDAHERRISLATPATAGPPPLDEPAVQRGARLIKLTEAERQEYELNDDGTPD
jgi:hypothetical protein